MFLLIIILGGTAAAYWYYTNYILETPKSAFFKYVGNNNIDNVLDLDIYYNMLEQMGKKSFLAETSADFTTTMKNDLTEMVDTSKFDFLLNISADKVAEKSLVDAKITYSSNELFNLKLLNTKDIIGIGSEEILDKYIASSKEELDNSLEKSTGIQTDVSADFMDDAINSISTNKIEMEESYKSQKISEYFDMVYQLIPNEAVTKKENVVVTIDTEAINTDAYILNLDSDKYQEVLKSTLEKLKGDDELLNKLVTGKEIIVAEENVRESDSINTIPNIKIESEFVEGEVETHETEMTVLEVEGAGEENNLEVVREPETNLVDDTTLDTTTVPNINLNVDDFQVVEKKSEENIENVYQDLVKALILGQKIDGTVQELQDKIDEEISKIPTIKDGITITVYVRNEEGKAKEGIKLVSDLPYNTSLDIEYMGNTKFKITYLAPEKNEEGKEISAGYSVEVEKKSSDVNIKYNIQNSRIENKKVVSKTQIELQTNNSNPSKGYTNSAIIKYTNVDGDLKVNVKNEIKFQEQSINEEFTDENTIFVNELSAEEAQNLYVDLFQQVMSVYAEKLLSLSFIDNNSSNSIVQQPVVEQTNSEEKQVIKSKLIETVSIMMGEAEQNGEDFTIQNLADLSIDGYDVSAIISADLAVIKINGYTFNIDKDFMLSE